jgi:hypothetical protein
MINKGVRWHMKNPATNLQRHNFVRVDAAVRFNSSLKAITTLNLFSVPPDDCCRNVAQTATFTKRPARGVANTPNHVTCDAGRLSMRPVISNMHAWIFLGAKKNGRQIERC